jgi:hypothetical protein
MFGGTLLVISGPCFSQTDSVSFDTLYSENNLQIISPLTSDITKDTESVWLKHGPDITNNVPPNMEASFGVIVNVP